MLAFIAASSAAKTALAAHGPMQHIKTTKASTMDEVLAGPFLTQLHQVAPVYTAGHCSVTVAYIVDWPSS